MNVIGLCGASVIGILILLFCLHWIHPYLYSIGRQVYRSNRYISYNSISYGFIQIFTNWKRNWKLLLKHWHVFWARNVREARQNGSRPMSNNKLLLNFCVKSATTVRVVVVILCTRLKWISPITEYYSQSAVPVVMLWESAPTTFANLSSRLLWPRFSISNFRFKVLPKGITCICNYWTEP